MSIGSSGSGWRCSRKCGGDIRSGNQSGRGGMSEIVRTHRVGCMKSMGNSSSYNRHGSQSSVGSQRRDLS
jgi:hypothetical protein